MVLRHVVLVAAALTFGLAVSADAQPAKPKPDDMVNNPPYAHWSALKPGATVTQREVVSLPDGRKLELVITHKLVQKNRQRAVVETTVKENIPGMVESSRTVTSYPAQVKMSEAGTADVSVSEGKEEVTVKGKKVAAEWVEAVTRYGDEVWTEKMWTARDIPGGIIKRTLTRKRGDAVLSESVLEIVDFKSGS
jgi:hypothetical protein